ncbi:MAG: hypothetical protein ACPHK8_00330 [Thermoplasmatota archaeon]
MMDTLLRGIFDYAGMFPPAALSFEEALEESARFGGLDRPFLVGGDMVLMLPEAAKLTPEALKAAQYPRHELLLCLVGIHKGNLREAIDFAKEDHGIVRVTAIEAATDLSEDWVSERDELARHGISLYVEPRITDADWPAQEAAVWAFVDRLNEGGRVGLKVRAAGPTALRAATFARIIGEVNARGIPFKATQGLHHPIPEERYGNEFGFLGLAMALRLDYALGLSEAERLDIMLSDEPADFVLYDGFGFKAKRAMAQRVTQAMQAVPFSIGSCSLSEPDGDLTRLFDSPRPAHLLE